MSVDLDTKLLGEFTRRLTVLETKKKRIYLKTLWQIFAEIFAHRPGIPQRRRWLLEALRYAEKEGIIAFPKTVWERIGEPPLPKYVELISAPRKPKDTRWKTNYWHPQLAWVADLDFLKDEYEQFLHKVDKGLKEGWFDDPAPLNYRSVQLTGKEKRLKELFTKKLFSPGYLTIEMLNIIPGATPLAYEFVGKKPIALVFENKEPFNVARAILSSLPDSPYGILVHGSGNSFVDSVSDFLQIQNSLSYRSHFNSPLEQIHYVGDLDWAGLRIANRVVKTAQKYELPPVVPATHIHKAMLDSLSHEWSSFPDGFPCPKSKNNPVVAPSLVEWLPANVRADVLRILTLGNRIPEEMLTHKTLRHLWSVEKSDSI